MFEGVISDILVKYLGEYVKDLNKEQLKIGIWKGDVKLKNLELKKEALTALNLPIEVRSGFLGEVVVKIPWKKLKSKPVIINLDNIVLLASPRTETRAYDAEAERKAEFERKKARVAAAEVARRAREKEAQDASRGDGYDDVSDSFSDSTESTKESKSKKPGFKERLVSKIVNNIQVNISGVHVRYEDCFSEPKHPVSVGVMMRGISAVSTDANWAPAYLDTKELTEAVVHKLVTLEGLSFYVNRDAEMLSSQDDDFIRARLREWVDISETDKEMEFILRPMNSEAKLELRNDESGVPEFSIPQLGFDVVLEQLSLNLTEIQMHSVFKQLEFFSHLRLGERYRKLRPRSTVRENPREWFQFAQRAVLMDVREKTQRTSWKFLFERRNMRKRYIELYKRSKNVKWLPPLKSAEEKAELEKLFEDLSAEDIIFFQSLAEKGLQEEAVLQKALVEYEKKLKKRRKEAKKTRSFFGWGGKKKKKEEAEDGEEKQNAPVVTLSEEEQQALYETIGYDAAQQGSGASSPAPRDYVKMLGKVRVNSTGLTLYNRRRERLIDCRLEGLSTGVTIRPDSQKFKVALDGFTAVDCFTKGSMFQQICGPPRGAITSTSAIDSLDSGDAPVVVEKLLSVTFEQNPLDGHADVAIGVRMKPLEIIYSKELTERLMRFFKSKQSVDLQNLQQAALTQFKNIRRATKDQLADALKKHKTMDVQINIDAPMVIIPEDVRNENCVLCVLDLGQLEIISKVRPKLSEDDAMQEATEADFYDSFDISLSEVQCLVCSNDLPWKEREEQARGEMRLIERFDINVSVQNCIMPSNLSLPKLKVSGELPEIALHINTLKYMQIMKLVAALTAVTPEHVFAQEGPAGDDLEQKSELLPHEADMEAVEVPIVLATSTAPSEKPQLSKVEEQMLVDRIVIDAQFAIAKLSVGVSREIETESVPLVSVTCCGLVAAYVQRTFDKHITASLASIQAVDRYIQDESAEEMIASKTETGEATTEDDPLFFVDCWQFAQEHPQQGQLNLSVTAVFAALRATMNQETVAQLVMFGMDGSTEVAHIRTVTENEIVAARKTKEKAGENEGEEKKKKQKKHKKPKSAKPPEEVLKMQVVVSVAEVSLQVNEPHHPLTRVGVAGVAVSVQKAEKKMTISGSVRSVELLDCSKESDAALGGVSLYPRVISPKDETQEMVLFTFEKNSILPGERNPLDIDQKITLDCRALEVVFVERYFRHIMDTVQNGPLMAAMSYSARKGKEALKERKTEAKKILELSLEHKKLLAFDLRLVSPDIVIPKSHDSPEAVVMSFGTFTLSNEFSGEMGSRVEQLVVSLVETSIETKTEGDGTEKRVPVLSECDVECVVLRPVDDNRKIPQMKIDSSLSPFLLSFSEEQYLLCMAIYDTINTTLINPPISEEDQEKERQRKRREKKVQEARKKAVSFGTPLKDVPKMPDEIKKEKEHALKELRMFLISIRMSEYVDAFVANGCDSMVALGVLDDESLQSIGVEKLVHRKMILAAIEKFKQKEEQRMVAERNLGEARKEKEEQRLRLREAELALRKQEKEERRRKKREAEIVTEIEATFTVPHIDCELLRSRDSPLVSGRIGRVGISFSRKSDETMSASVSLGGMELVDARRDTDVVFKHILRSSGDELVALKYSRDAEKDSMDIEISKLQVVAAGASLLVEVKEFFVPPVKVEAQKRKERKKLKSDEEAKAAALRVLEGKKAKNSRLDKVRRVTGRHSSLARGSFGGRGESYESTVKFADEAVLKGEADKGKGDVKEQEGNDKESEEEPGRDMVIKCRILSPEIIVVEAPDLERSRSFVMSADIDVSFAQQAAEKEMTVSCVVNQLQAYQGIVNAEDRLMVVRPFDLTIDLKMSGQGTASASTAIECSVAPIDIRLSYEVVLFWVLTMKAFQQPFEAQKRKRSREEITQERKEKEQELRQREKEEFLLQTGGEAPVSTPNSSDDGSSDGDAGEDWVEVSRVDELTGAVEEKPSKNVKEVCTIQFSGLFLYVTNDCGGRQIPTLEAHFTQIEGCVSNWSSDLEASITLSSSIDYYNNTLVAWEPIMEVFSCEFIARKSTAAKKPRLMLVLNAQDPLNINVSYAAVHDGLWIATTWMKDLAMRRGAGEASDVVSFDPYVIRNYTGIPITWWTEYTKKATLAPGQSEPIDLGSHAYYKIRPDLPRVACVQLEERGKIIRTPFDRVGERAVESFYRNMRVVVRCATIMEDGAKALQIGTHVQYFNRSTMPMELQWTGAGGECVPVFSEPVEPQGSDFIPLLFANEGHVYARTPGHNWTKIFDMTNLRRAWEYCTFGGGDRPHTLHGLLQPDADQVLFDYFHTEPLSIQNLLPVRCGYRLTAGKGDKVVKDGALEPGEKEFFATTSWKPSHYVRIYLEGYEESTVGCVLGDSLSSTASVSCASTGGGPPLSLRIDSANQGTRNTVIYCPIWVVNETGSSLAIREFAQFGSSSGVLLSMDPKANHLFSPSGAVLEFGKRKAEVRVCDPTGAPVSKWSRPFSVETAGTNGSLEIPGVMPNSVFEYSVAISFAEEPFSHSRVVTLRNRYTILNRSEEPIRIKQTDTPTVRVVKPKTSLNYHWANAKKPRTVQFQCGEETSWSGGVSLDNVGETALAIKAPLKGPRLMKRQQTVEWISMYPGEGGVEARTAKEEGVVGWMMVRNNTDECASSINVFVSHDLEEEVSYAIENQTSLVCSFVQKGVAESEMCHLQPRSGEGYAWSEPSRSHVLIVEFLGQYSAEYKLDVIGVHEKTLNFSMDGRDFRIHAACRIRGASRVLVLWEDRGSGTHDSIEKVVKEEVLDLDVTLSLAGIGISLISDVPQEFAYVAVSGLQCSYAVSNLSTKIELEIVSLQIDNQNHRAIYPVLFMPNPNNPEDRPFIHVSIVKSNLYKTIDFFNYMSILVQEMDIAAEELVVNQILRFWNQLQPLIQDLSTDKTAKAVTRPSTPTTPTTPSVRSGEAEQGDFGDAGGPSWCEDESEKLKEWVEPPKKLYFELFHLQPIKANLTFKMNPKNELAFSPTSPFNVVIKTLGTTISNIEGAPLHLNALVLNNPFLTSSELMQKITKHYVRQGMMEVYKILGSFDFLGNPVGLFSNISTGMMDFFYEPANGLISSPEQFAEGLAKGTMSLISNTLWGTFNSAAAMSGAIGKGVAALTLDDDFISSRHEGSHAAPQHAIDGISQGAASFGRGFRDGMTGVVMQPLKGVQKDGLKGLALGSVRGVAGIAFKPVSGTVDAVTKTAVGIRNTATMFDKRSGGRVRPPRQFSMDKVLRPFNYEESSGQHLLSYLAKGQYAEEQYMFHHSIQTKDRETVILTHYRVILLDRKENELWNVAFGDILGVKRDSRFLHIEARLRKQGAIQSTMAQARSSSSSARKVRRIIRCDSEETGMWITLKVTACINSYQAALREFEPDVTDE